MYEYEDEGKQEKSAQATKFACSWFGKWISNGRNRAKQVSPGSSLIG